MKNRYVQKIYFELNVVEQDQGQVRKYILQNCDVTIYWVNNFIKLHIYIIVIIYNALLLSILSPDYKNKNWRNQIQKMWTKKFKIIFSMLQKKM